MPRWKCELVENEFGHAEIKKLLSNYHNGEDYINIYSQ